ncbi:MAG: guanylate kinase [Candidatus Omnitrophota bacterium]|nr:guanylate kinase [Candidatus Omnitrophota bacterium]
MRRGKIIILSGPSGSGKTTLYQKILASKKLSGRLIRCVSITTRSRRAGEKHGRDYFFISPKAFLFKKRSGHFLESQKVFGNYYGTPQKGVKDLLKEGKNVLLTIDVKGANVVRRKLPHAITIFVKVPSLAILKERLKQRGTETNQSLSLRMKVASEEMKQAREYDYVIVNDNFSSCYQQLAKLILRIV